MLVAFASHRGSPGVTTAALAATHVAAGRGWDVVLVEADADGGTIRYLAPELEPDQNLLSYAVETMRDDSAATMRKHSQPLVHGGAANVLIAPPLGRQVSHAIDMVTPAILEAAKHPERLVIVDCGRISGPAARLFTAADEPYLLVGNRHDLVLSLKDFVGEITREHKTRVMLVGDKPYDPDQVTRIGLTCDGVIAYDPKAAGAIRGTEDLSAKKLSRSPFMQDIERIVPDLLDPGMDEDRGLTLSIGGGPDAPGELDEADETAEIEAGDTPAPPDEHAKAAPGPVIPDLPTAATGDANTDAATVATPPPPPPAPNGSTSDLPPPPDGGDEDMPPPIVPDDDTGTDPYGDFKTPLFDDGDSDDDSDGDDSDGGSSIGDALAKLTGGN